VEMSSNDVSRLSSVGGDLLIYAGIAGWFESLCYGCAE